MIMVVNKKKWAIYIVIIIITIAGAMATAFATNHATQVDFLAGGLQDTSGNPIAGGRVYTYEPGTTNHKNMYANKTKTTTATYYSDGIGGSYIKLDTYGKALVFADGYYKISVSNSAGTMLFSLDNLYFPHKDTNIYDAEDYASFNACNTAIGATNAILVMDKAFDIATSTTTTIGANTTLWFGRNGSLNKTTGAFLTINGNLIADSHAIFTGFTAGDITFGQGYVFEANPTWWGLVTTDTAGTTNDIAMDSAIKSGIRTVKVPRGTFKMDSDTTISNAVLVDGSGKSETIFDKVTAGNAVFVIETSNVTLKNFKTTDTGVSIPSIRLDKNADFFKLSNLHLATDDDSIQINNIGGTITVYNGEISNCYIANTANEGISTTATGTYTVVLGVHDNVFDTVTDGIDNNNILDKGWLVTGNVFKDCSANSIDINNGQDWSVFGNTFVLSSGGWGGGKRAIKKGANAKGISIGINTYLPNDGSQLSISGNDFISIDPMDGIRYDNEQKIYGHTWQQARTTGSPTTILQGLVFQTKDLVQYKEWNGTVTASGVTAYGNPYNTTLQLISTFGTGTVGTATIDCQAGNSYYHNLTGTTTVIINNPQTDMYLELVVNKGTSTNGCGIIWSAGTTGVHFDGGSGAGDSNGTYTAVGAVDKRDFIKFKYYNIGSVTGWYEMERRINLKP